MSKYNFGGGNLGFQDGRMQKVCCSIAPQRGNIDITGCTYIVGVEDNMGRLINFFAVAILKFKIAAILDII